jgi:hypothetical protein
VIPQRLLRPGRAFPGTVAEFGRPNYAFFLADTRGDTRSHGLRFGATSIFADDVVATLDFYLRAFGLEGRFYDPDCEFGELETGGPPLAFGSHRLGARLRPDTYLRPESVSEKSVVASCSSFVLLPRFSGEFRGRERGTRTRTRTRREPNSQTRSQRAIHPPPTTTSSW